MRNLLPADAPTSLRRACAAFVLGGVLFAPASAALATPVYDYFGPLDEATFGGSGISNDEVAVAKQVVDGDVMITVALSATARYSNPPLGNDDAGTYFAGPGGTFGGSGESTTEGALWNWNVFLRVEGTNGANPVLDDYDFTVHYDFAPGFDTPLSQLGSIDANQAVGSEDTLGEQSQNLLFGFLANPVPGTLDPPAGSFDPDALGEYNFVVTVEGDELPLETVAMDVQVTPEPGLALLLAGGLGAASLAARRR